VLLVIFILTAPLLASSIKPQLPKADMIRLAACPSIGPLVVNARGAVFLNDQPIELRAAYPSAANHARTRTPRLRLRDARVPYGRVVEVMGYW
jgi:biopolymer transport protein TolR